MSELIEKARAFAESVHAGQSRKNAEAEPYIVHLREVAELVARFGGSETAICAAWLHDSVEDQPVTSSELEDLFGPHVARIVDELTDDKSLPKPERKRQQVEHAPDKSPEAALIKIADKTSNIHAVGARPPADWSRERKLEYIRWGEEVVSALPDVAPEARRHFERVAAEARARVEG